MITFRSWLQLEVLFVIASVLLILLAVTPSFMIFPLNYGWWQVWADMEAQGLTLYEDTKLVFPPLFIKWTGFVQSMNPTRPFSMAVGVIVLFTLQAAFTLLLQRFFSLFAALFGGALIAFMQVKLTTFIPDDYHLFERLFFTLCLLFFVLSLEALNTARHRKAFLFMALAAASSMVTLYTKQNIGMFLVVSILFAYLVYAPRCNRPVTMALTAIFLFVAMFGIFQLMLGMSLNHWNSLIFGNDAKGDLLVLATNFFTVSSNKVRIFEALIALPAILLLSSGIVKTLLPNLEQIVERLRSYSIGTQLTDILGRITQISLPSVIVIIIGYVMLFKVHLIVSIALIVIGFMTVRQFSKQPPVIFYLCFPFGGLMYASSMTSAFVPDSAIMPAIFGFAYLINLFKANDTDSYKPYHASGAKLAGHFMISIIVIFGLNIASEKFQTPYSWWGYTLPNATIGKVQSPFEDMRPQKLDSATAGALAKITKAVARYSVSNNDVLFYPHIPMQYQIQGKTPPTESIVHWFDVISSDVMSKDFAQLKRTRPKVVVIFDPPYQTYLGHMEFKRSNLIQQDFLAWMTEMQSAGTYKLVEYSYHGTPGFQQKDEEIRVTNSAFAQLSAKEQFEQIRGKCSGYVSEVIDDRAKFNLEINLALKDIENLDSFSSNDDENPSWIKLNLGSKVVFAGCAVHQYEELVKIIGSIDKQHEHTYRLKIFVRDAAVSQIEG